MLSFDVFHLFQEFEDFLSGIAEVGEDVGVAVDIEAVGIIEQNSPVIRILDEVFGIKLQRDIESVGGLDDFERVRFFKPDTDMSDAVDLIVVSFQSIYKTFGDFFRVAFENFFMVGQDYEVAFDTVDLQADVPGLIQQIGFYPENHLDVIVDILPAFARRSVGFL